VQYRRQIPNNEMIITNLPSSIIGDKISIVNIPIPVRTINKGVMEEKEEILFSTDENRFRAALQDFLHRMNAKELEREIYERDSYPRALYKRLGEAGFLAQVLPPEYGGRGSLTCEAILTEELGAACVPLAWIHSTSSYVYATISRFGTEEQKERFLGPMRMGMKTGAIAITEPDAGSDVMRIRTRAELKGNGYEIRGEKRNITNGSKADVLLVWAITDPQVEPARGMSAFIVEPCERKGFEVIEDYKLLGGFPGTVNSHIQFDGLSVPRENLLGKVNEGVRILFDELAIERVLYAAMLVGEARPVVELAADYSMEREQFGTPISRFEAVSFKLADMVTKLEAARLMVYHTTRLIDAGYTAEKESAMSKLLASEAFFESAHNTLQILGGRGLSEYPAEWAFRMARLSMIPAGTNEIMRYIVQREIYKAKAKARKRRRS